MSTFSTILLILLILVVGFSGYYYLDTVSQLKTEAAELGKQSDELMFRVQQLEHENAGLARELEDKIKQISSTKNDEIKKLKSTYEELILNLQEQVESGDIAVTRMADRLNVKIVNKILFPSGKANISPEGKQVLKRLGRIFKTAGNKHIKVAGHTDNIPIHRKLKSQFSTNWELSVIRATNVVRFLIDDVGVDPHRIEASGFGENRPVATNKTRAGRLRNRRIEILLLPE